LSFTKEKLMKIFTLAVAAMLCAVPPVAIDAAGAASRPFKAAIHGFAAPVPTSPCELSNDETATAQVSHLGRSEMVSHETVDLCSNPEAAEISGQFTMTAANGDQLFGTYETLGHLDFANDEVTFSGQFTITGGSGRFQDASGGGSIEGSGVLSPPFDVFANMNGRIVY
jgi:hypothetical protein